MRASQFVKFVLGPAMATSLAAIALAVSLRSTHAPVESLVASVTLIGLIAASAGLLHATRRERRRTPRDEPRED